MAEIEKYKVLIPTAGIGSRLGNLTKFLNKSLISIENKPAISRIIEMFPSNSEFVIALGYKGNLVRQFLQLAYPNRKFYFVYIDKYEGIGSGLGKTVLACEEYLNEPFVFCSCDTIVNEKIIFPTKNIIGYSVKDEISEYRTLQINNNKVLKINEKNCPGKNKTVYIGLSFIYDWEIFLNEMHNGGQNAIDIGEVYALNKLAQKGKLFAQKFTWFDTGNLIELKKTQAHFKENNSPTILKKENEDIWFINDKVIKFSDDKNFIKDRIIRTKYIKDYIPEIISYTENMYSYKKANGYVLSQINNTEIFTKLLKFSKDFWAKKELSEGEKIEFNSACEKFYYNKTIQRVNLYYKTFNIKDTETIINGQQIPKLTYILSKLDKSRLFDGLPGRFHGDFHFENILYDEKNDKFIFLDWRQNFVNYLNIGDIYYDLAKLLHGLIISHDLIANNKYMVKINETEVNYKFERKTVLKECEKLFYDWLKENNYDVKKVKILTAIIFLNISPLHHYPYCHLLYNLGKAMLYKEIC